MIRRMPFAAIILAGTLAAGAASAQMNIPAPQTDPAQAAAGVYEIDPSHASVVARVRHMGLSNYAMSFDKVQASYTYDPKAPAASKIEVTIDANSLNTGIKDHGALFAKEFLGAAEHPQITFVSTKIDPGQDGHGTITGDLTLNGVTKPVSLDTYYRGAQTLMGQHRMGFSATATIDRTDFGAKSMPGALGDDVDLVIEVEFAKK